MRDDDDVSGARDTAAAAPGRGGDDGKKLMQGGAAAARRSDDTGGNGGGGGGGGGDYARPLAEALVADEEAGAEYEGERYTLDEALDRCGRAGYFQLCMLAFTGLSWSVRGEQAALWRRRRRRVFLRGLFWRHGSRPVWGGRAGAGRAGRTAPMFSLSLPPCLFHRSPERRRTRARKRAKKPLAAAATNPPSNARRQPPPKQPKQPKNDRMVDAMEVMVLVYLAAAAKCEWGLSTQQEALLTSMVFLGMCLGAPVWGAVSDARGRKFAFGLGMLVTCIFGFASAAAPNVAALMAFRTLVGFGIPSACVAFNWLGETCPASTRGLFLVGIEGFWCAFSSCWFWSGAGGGRICSAARRSGARGEARGPARGQTTPLAALAPSRQNKRAPKIAQTTTSKRTKSPTKNQNHPKTNQQQQQQQINRTIGTVAQALLAYALLNKYGWRVMLTVSAVPTVLLLLLLPFVPESPRYLAVKGRTDEADAVVRRIVRFSRKVPPPGRLQPLPVPAARPPPPAGAAKGAVLAWRARSARDGLLEGLRGLLSRPLLPTTCVLVFVWMSSAHVYYGLSYLVGQISFMSGGSKTCDASVGGRLRIPNEDLTGILITACAEVPGLALSLLLVHLCSRRVAFAAPMTAIAVVLVPLMAGVSGAALIAPLFLSRMFVYAAFAVVWTTAELYPTSVRGFALGFNNSMSRIGGMLASYAVAGRETGWAHTPEAVFFALSLASAAALMCLPQRDAKGAHLADTVEDVEERQRLEEAKALAAGGGSGFFSRAFGSGPSASGSSNSAVVGGAARGAGGGSVAAGGSHLVARRKLNDASHQASGGVTAA